MKDDSKLFNSIRIKPRRGPAEEKPRDEPVCDWEGCDRPGVHKAPKGAKAEGEFHNFCLEHVRHYNKAYNYFSGMSDTDIAAHMDKINAPGAKGTQPWGSNRFGRSNPEPRQHAPRDYSGSRFHDPHNLFKRVARNQARNGAGTGPREVRLSPQDKIAFETLGLEGRKPTTEIKAAYKALVKLHHPDANGGDTSSEERLRAIISAYNHLKTKGFV